MKKLFIGFLLSCFILTFCGLAITWDARCVGSKRSNKYHYAWCDQVKRIRLENRVMFESPEEAIAAGYTPCEACKPKAEFKNSKLRQNKVLMVIPIGGYWTCPSCKKANKSIQDVCSNCGQEVEVLREN